MAKRIRNKISTLCCSLIALLGFGACKSSKLPSPEPSPAERLRQQIEAAEKEGKEVSDDIKQSQKIMEENERYRHGIEVRPVVYGPPPVRK